MLRIEKVENRYLKGKGITKGAKLLSINGHEISDQFDLMFHSEDVPMIINFVDVSGKKKTLKLSPSLINDIEFEPLKPKKCGANCIFCFVEQLPSGLRKTLYHKDEDYRFSYLYGNYVAMANITKKDLQKIALYKLSPLYISVHTTNPELRGKMLGIKKSAPILPYIDFLTKSGIKLHCQIVLCPNINDGRELERTLKDLSKFYPSIESVAVVPVGLTSHRNSLYPLTSFDKEGARKVIFQVKKLQKEFLRLFRNPFVFLSDEFYLLASQSLPPANFYCGFPQIENGVGITRQVVDDAKAFLNKKLKKDFLANKKIAVVTGILPYKVLSCYMKKFVRKTNVAITLYPVINRLFGERITVTGLLSGKDIMSALNDKKFDYLFIPDVALRDKRDTFLDDVTIYDLKRYFQKKVYTFRPFFSELYKKLLKLTEGGGRYGKIDNR